MQLTCDLKGGDKWRRLR